MRVSEETLLALGSNLGDRLGYLRVAVRSLRERLELVAVSSVYESAPQGMAEADGQADFLNAVLRGRTTLEPRELLGICHTLEAAAGRERPHPRAPRTLDVDIVFHGSRVIRTEELTVPHPRWRARGFVLAPLLEIAPHWRDPETGRTVESFGRERSELLETVRVVAPADVLSR